MLIECPFCHARAQIPESKEGAKVRCGECGRVYGARPAGRDRSTSQTNPVPFIVGGLVIVIGAVLFAVINNNQPEPRRLEQPEQRQAYVAAPTGWDSPAVQAVVKLQAATSSADRTLLLTRLDGAAIHAARAAEGDPAWSTLEGFQRQEFLNALVDDLSDTSNPDAVVNWTPFDGSVVHEALAVYTVRVDCTPSAGGAESRTFEYVVVEEPNRFLLRSWGPYVDPDAVVRGPKKPKGYDKVTLSDGSVVHEREPEPLEHLEDTPAELRAEIEELYATIIDLDLTKEVSRAKARMVEIGKPCIPRLLTGLFEIPLEDFDDARQVQNVVDVLRQITDQRFGYEPLQLVGSAMGTTEERRQSSIKQWFAWWYKFGRRFEVAEKTDALDDIIELTDKEKAELERFKD